MSPSIWLFAGICVVALFYLVGFFIYQHFYYESGDGAAQNMRSYNKTLDKKLSYMPYQEPRWFILYMNVILPTVAFLSLYGIINFFFSEPSSIVTGVIDILLRVVLVMNAFFFRFVDKTAYNFNICANIALLVMVVFPSVLQLLFPPMEGMGGLNVMSLGFMLVIWGPVVVCNLLYFKKRKEIFFCSAKELRAEYGDEEEEKAAEGVK